MAIPNEQLEDFPRSSGSHFSVNKSVKTIDTNDQLFKTRGKRVNKKLKTKKFDISLSTPASKVVIENLTLSKLIENTIVYGCIQEIGDFELKLSITGGIVVTIPITNISNSYTELVQKFANDATNSDDVEIAKLSSIFNIGDYYPVKVLSKLVCDQYGHSEVIGTLNPVDIFKNFSSRTVSKLEKGFNVVCSVISQEDYGYQMDIGINDVKSFLSFDDLRKNFSSINLCVGQLVQCCILEATERSIILSTNRKLAQFKFESIHEPSIYSYLPGVSVDAIITNVSNFGLELSLPGGYKGFVPRYHISEDILKLPKSFKINDNVNGHVLYMHPHTKQICISLKQKLEKKTIRNLISSIKPGLIIEKSIVCARAEFGAIILKLLSDSFAICQRKNLSDLKDIESSIEYPIGSTHRCRVKKFHLFDNLIEVSLKKSFIESKDLSTENLKIGEIVEGTIKKHKKAGVYVRLGFALNGFIPRIHTTDSVLSNQFNIEKAFPLNKTIKCRITRLNLNSVTPKISLTAKKTLLSLSQSSIFQDFSKIKEGMSSHGVVCLINDKGILLEFFGNVRGFIPIKYLATYKIEHPDKVFSIGQVVKCTVISVNVELERLVCSLIGYENPNKLNTVISNKKLMNSSLNVGDILRNLKIVSKTFKKGFDLTNSKQSIQVFLPLAHLSDDYFISRLLFASLKIGDTIDKLLVFSKDDANVISVTRKKVFLDNAESLVMNESDIKLNCPFPAIVRNVTPTGVFFELPNSKYGVIRRKYLLDNFCDDPNRIGLFKGQTICVIAFDFAFKKVDDDQDNQFTYLKKFKFSMRLSDVWDKSQDSRVAISLSDLSNYNLALNSFKSKYEKMEDIQNNLVHLEMKNLLNFSVGQVVTYIVTDILDKHIALKISLTGGKNEQTVPGLAFKYTQFDNLSVSHMGNAVVCDIDFEKRMLIVFIQPQSSKIVRQIRNCQKNNFSKNIKLDQQIKGTIIYVCPRFALASLCGHAPGVLAYISSKRHYNDFGNAEKVFSIGEDYQFIVKHLNVNGFVLAVVNTQPKMLQKLRERKESKIELAKDNRKASQIEVEESPQIAQEKNVVNEFDWNIPDLNINLKNKPKSEDHELSSDSDDDCQTTPTKKLKTREERSEISHQLEYNLRKKESELSNIERTLQDEQDFEMALLASPNSSLIWLKYVAFFLENNDINKARSIGERALEKISFREEKEKFNIWVGLLNLENTYGDEASLKKLIERAIKFNNPKAIYLQLASIFINSNKKEKAEQTYHLAIKKFKQDQSVWNEFLLFYMKNQQFESARKLFKRALLSLDTRDHIEVISKFAQLEFTFGDCEQAKTIFETLLATYWKRLDKWLVYIDMLIKHTVNESDIDTLEFVRNIFERLLTFKFSQHKLKSVLKKYFEFESKYSADNGEVLDRLHQKALEYDIVL